MQVKQLLLALFLYSGFSSYGQQPYYNQQENFLKANSVWAFGNGAGLDFNSGSPVAIHTKMICEEGGTSVADPVTGKLLFYSNGYKVWNANNQLMPNGDSLLGNYASVFIPDSIPGAYSTVQGVCIVPVIGTSDQYYLFSLSGATSNGPKSAGSMGGNEPAGTLFYNVVDMSLDNGLGDIPAGKKNIPLNRGDYLSECMIAIPGNNCDVWLMVYKYKPSEEFMAYHITKDGIDTTPVTSPSIPMYALNNPARAVTCMAVSPDRTKIAMDNFFFIGSTLIGTFDPNTGQVPFNRLMTISDNQHDTNNVVTGYGICFSPDGSKLYIGGNYSGTLPFNPKYKTEYPSIYQYDLNVYNSTAISNSMQKVGFIPIPIDPRYNQTFGMMTLYNDTVYVISTGAQFGYNGWNAYINRINQPNLPGAACGFQPNAISLLPGDSSLYGLHNNVVFPISDSIITRALDTTVCPNEDLVLKPVEDYQFQYIWDDSSTTSKRVIDKAGIYWVIQSDGCHTYIDTFIVKNFDMPEPVINVNVLALGIVGNFNYSSYQWLLNGEIIPGATDSTYTVTENGKYQVIVNNKHGCTDTSEVYIVTNATGINAMHTLSGQINIYPNPANGMVHINAPVVVNLSLCSIEGKILKEVKKSNQVSLQGLAEGIYFLQIYGQDGRLLKAEKIIKTL